MKMIKMFLQLIRINNLLIMALILLVIRYGFLLPLGFSVSLTAFWHALMILSTVLIAAGGNVINDAFDVLPDQINKPERQIVGIDLSRQSALRIGQFLLFAGATLGLLMGFFNKMFTLSYIFPIAAILLWFYNANLKKLSLIGNISIAFLAALLVANAAVFDLLKTLSFGDREFQLQAVWVIAVFALFSSLITFAREVIKDIEDMPGDREAGYDTLPITSGTAFAKILVILALMLLVIGVSWLFVRTISQKDFISAPYLLIFVILPLLYLILKVGPAEEPEQFDRLSRWLKWVMIAGILAIPVLTLSVRMALE